MITLDEARTNIGRSVIYWTPGGCTYYEGVRFEGRAEAGVITSVNDHFVFVRYGSDMHSKATSPWDLTWEHPHRPNPSPAPSAANG